MIAGGDHVTYSPDHVAVGKQTEALLAALNDAISDLRQLVSALEDASTMPARVPDVDTDGRHATRQPGRPTEKTALDELRAALRTELNSADAMLPRVIAIVRGLSASMDRALARWEGEEPVLHHSGGPDDHSYGSAGH
ncbi:DUF7169 domain-containing protein [Streptomyces silvensis]|uniref:DUF7169 domain-containing protein n=1 Tax=Streptomyces silvensis TaxID=1765722 RepID=UPI003D678975